MARTCSRWPTSPYFGEKLGAYAALGFLLGQTTRISGVVTVTNCP
jgi:hypothetical protein